MHPTKIKARITRGTTVPNPEGGIRHAKEGEVLMLDRDVFLTLCGQQQAVEVKDNPAKPDPAKLADSAGKPIQTR